MTNNLDYADYLSIKRLLDDKMDRVQVDHLNKKIRAGKTIESWDILIDKTKNRELEELRELRAKLVAKYDSPTAFLAGWWHKTPIAIGMVFLFIAGITTPSIGYSLAGLILSVSWIHSILSD